MKRLPIALVLAIAAMAATAGQGGNATARGLTEVAVEGKGVPTIAADTGLSRDARAQQAIDAATAAALIGALQSRFQGYDVQLQLGDVRTSRASLRDLALDGEASLRLGKDERWMPIHFEALYDTTEQTVLSPNIVLGGTLASSRPARGLPLRGLQAAVDRAMDLEYISNQVDFSIAFARVVGDDGVRLVVQGDGVARFDGDERVRVKMQAVYDRNSKRWVDPQYALIDG